eukprot:5940355-Amphidinium_carterae.1
MRSAWRTHATVSALGTERILRRGKSRQGQIIGPALQIWGSHVQAHCVTSNQKATQAHHAVQDSLGVSRRTKLKCQWKQCL